MVCTTETVIFVVTLQIMCFLLKIFFRTLTALPLSPHLTPIAIKSAKTLSSDSPFIFSPMQNLKKQPKNMSKLGKSKCCFPNIFFLN